MRRLAIAALLAAICLFSAALGEGVSGQRYDTFLEYYEADLAFINSNDSRHLLPLGIKKSTDVQEDGLLHYGAESGALTLTLGVEPISEVIMRCEITLTAPENLVYGNSQYNEFAISGYQSYALLMAMDANAEPYDRYGLVTNVVDGMADDGEHTVQLGVYTLKCTREGGVATLLFEHRLAAPSDGGATDDAPAEESTDEGAGLG